MSTFVIGDIDIQTKVESIKIDIAHHVIIESCIYPTSTTEYIDIFGKFRTDRINAPPQFMTFNSLILI